MCGRISRGDTPGYYIEKIAPDALLEEDLGLRSYNIGPSTPLLALRVVNDCRTWAWLKWGFIPSWSKEPKSRMINARAETVFDKSSFRSAIRKRRCALPVDGYYEWQKLEKKKQPYFIYRTDGEPMLLAGIWECWRKGAKSIESCAVLTRSPEECIAHIHDRMPVVLEHNDCDLWLHGGAVNDLPPLTKSLNDGVLAYHTVSRRVNNPRNDSPDLTARESVAD